MTQNRTITMSRKEITRSEILRMAEEKKKKIQKKLREDYPEFGPTLTSEKLAEQGGIIVSKETVRQIMIGLDLIFILRFTHTLSMDLHFQFEHTVYQIVMDRPVYALQGRRVDVCQTEEGKLTVLLNSERLAFERYVRQTKRKPLSTGKDRKWKPSADHPWR